MVPCWQRDVGVWYLMGRAAVRGLEVEVASDSEFS